MKLILQSGGRTKWKGANVALLHRLIDRAIEVESTGLQGKAYVDARGIGLG